MLDLKYGFAPIADTRARILILGSMPSEASLAQQQYYAHPRNSFWTIIERLFDVSENLDYQGRQKLLLDKHIALWDVLQACERAGSLDASIIDSSIIVNPFEEFFEQHQNIMHVYFNGARAEKEFNRHVLPLPGIHQRHLQVRRLPSTSPAHAAMSLQQKFEAWRDIKEALA